MNPTQDSRIRESEWFILPFQPLMQYKIFSAKVDELMYYAVARRGVTEDALEIATDEVVSVMTSNIADIKDNAGNQFEKLRKFLDKPIH